jgi:hypothetical protein
MIQIETEDKRLLSENRHNNLKIWTAVIAAVLSSIAAIVTAFIK